MIIVPKCRKCGSTDLVQLRAQQVGPVNTKKFEPTHHCNKCGLDFIWHHPKDVLRDHLQSLWEISK